MEISTMMQVASNAKAEGRDISVRLKGDDSWLPATELAETDDVSVIQFVVRDRAEDRIFVDAGEIAAIRIENVKRTVFDAL